MSPAASHQVLVFHHIPKTAGTSFRTALYNLFGDERCVQIKHLDFLSTKQIEAALSASDVRLLCGHVPVRYVPPEWRRLAVTFVRDPIERVLSLYRFVLEQPLEVRAHIDLGETFTLREFLDCQHSDIASQIDNGMCRFLAREHSGQPIDGTHIGFRATTLTLYAAIESLNDMAVGVCERMQDSLNYLTALWKLPTPLTTLAENASRRTLIDAFPDEIAEIAERNALDTALYRRALAKLERSLQMPPEPIGPIVKPVTISPGGEYDMQALSARSGFNTVELPARLCWLSKGATARIHFEVSEAAIQGLSLRIYAGLHDYPVANAAFAINGARPAFAWRSGDEHWGTAFIGPFSPLVGVNVLEIRLPDNDPAATPRSLDPRQLTFAISTLQAH